VAQLPVYSTQLLRASSSTGLIHLDVPAGYVCVVRDIDAVAAPTSGNTLQAFVDGTAFWIVELGVEASFTWQSWRGRQVTLPAGLVQFSSSDVVDVVVSGYLLTLP
jgi:hypothetical protein